MPEINRAFPCACCGASKRLQELIVTPTGVGRTIQNLGVSPVAGHEWTVYRCSHCGYLEWFLDLS